MSVLKSADDVGLINGYASPAIIGGTSLAGSDTFPAELGSIVSAGLGHE
jgi:hypothetical protein